MAFFSQAWAITRKDLLTELRGRARSYRWCSWLLVVLVFNFGTEPGTQSASWPARACCGPPSSSRE
jgi:hypothetical protein